MFVHAGVEGFPDGLAWIGSWFIGLVAMQAAWLVGSCEYHESRNDSVQVDVWESA